MKKIFYVFMVMILLMSVMTSCSGVKESPIEDFKYEIENGEITITEYSGTEREITIPSKIEDRPVTVIGSKAFEDYDLVSIVIPDTVTIIESEAFRECDCLEKVTLSKQLKIIDDEAFYSCESLAYIDLPGSLKNIGDRAFDYCKSLTTIELPDNVNLGFVYMEVYKRLYNPFWEGTTIIVNEDSYAYEQIVKWESYGIKYETKSN